MKMKFLLFVVAISGFAPQDRHTDPQYNTRKMLSAQETSDLFADARKYLDSNDQNKKEKASCLIVNNVECIHLPLAEEDVVLIKTLNLFDRIQSKLKEHIQKMEKDNIFDAYEVYKEFNLSEMAFERLLTTLPIMRFLRQAKQYFFYFTFTIPELSEDFPKLEKIGLKDKAMNEITNQISEIAALHDTPAIWNGYPANPAIERIFHTLSECFGEEYLATKISNMPWFRIISFPNMHHEYLNYISVQKQMTSAEVAKLHRDFKCEQSQEYKKYALQLGENACSDCCLDFLNS